MIVRNIGKQNFTSGPRQRPLFRFPFSPGSIPQYPAGRPGYRFRVSLLFCSFSGFEALQQSGGLLNALVQRNVGDSPFRSPSWGNVGDSPFRSPSERRGQPISFPFGLRKEPSPCSGLLVPLIPASGRRTPGNSQKSASRGHGQHARSFRSSGSCPVR